MKKEKIKICFAASSGGHYEQLMMLKPLMEKYDSFVVTEKTDYKLPTTVLVLTEGSEVRVNCICCLKNIVYGVPN